MFFFFFNQKTSYEILIIDWSSDVCSSDLVLERGEGLARCLVHQALARLYCRGGNSRLAINAMQVHDTQFPCQITLDHPLLREPSADDRAPPFALYNLLL